MSRNHLPISANKLLFFSLLIITIAVLVGSPLSSLLREQQRVFAASDGGGSGGGDGGGSGGGDGRGGHHRHHHRSHGGSNTAGFVPASNTAAPPTSTSRGSQFSFREVLEVSPLLKGIVMTSATNKFVDSSGTLHIVGELRNNAAKTLNVNQMVATIYGLNNQTLGLDYATPVPAALSAGQSASFEFFVGGDQPIDGISDLSQIGEVKYHVGR